MATQTDLNTISNAIDSAFYTALTGGKPSDIILVTPPTPDANTITATAALTSYVQRCGNNVTDTKNLYTFIKGCMDLGIWNNMVCWPMRLGQNAVTGNTVYSLGGLMTRDLVKDTNTFTSASGLKFEAFKTNWLQTNINYSDIGLNHGAFTCADYSNPRPDPSSNVCFNVVLYGRDIYQGAAPDGISIGYTYRDQVRVIAGFNGVNYPAYLTPPTSYACHSVLSNGTNTLFYQNNTLLRNDVPVISGPFSGGGVPIIIGNSFNNNITFVAIFFGVVDSIKFYELYKTTLGQGLNLP